MPIIIGQEDRLGLLFELAADPMAIVDLRGYLLRKVNPMFRYLFGNDKIEGGSLLDLMHPEEAVAVRADSTGAALRGTRHFQTNGGDSLWLSLSATPCVGDNEAILIGRDVTEDKTREAELAHRAHYDAVTGLPNRHLFMDRVQQGLAQAGREQRGAAILFLDLDSFKPINDTYGHAVGDAVLRSVALRLRETVRQTDTVSRFAGDEFLVFLSMLRSVSEAEVIASRIRAVIGRPIAVGDVDVSVGVSCGVATFPEDGNDIDTLLLQADKRMYSQKKG